jgi:hypothetical protein
MPVDTPVMDKGLAGDGMRMNQVGEIKDRASVRSRTDGELSQSFP